MKRGRMILFVSVLLLSLILFMPLSLALSMFGLTAQGLSARAASGTIWSGRLAEARIGEIAVGDAAVGLKPISLLAGRLSIDMQGALGRGILTSMKSGFAIDNATAKLSTAKTFAPIPLDGLDLANVSVAFVGGKCEAAQGRVRATFTGDVGGLSLAQGLSGAARCERGALLLPLVSQSAMERLSLYLQGDGGYRAEFLVRSTDPAMAGKLGAAGFAPTPGGFVLRLAGKL
jgi:general secretion pathway protein N